MNTEPTLAARRAVPAEILETAHTLFLRLKSRSRSETFVPGSVAPELLRRCEELLGDMLARSSLAAAPDVLGEIRAALERITAKPPVKGRTIGPLWAAGFHSGQEWAANIAAEALRLLDVQQADGGGR